MNSDFQEMTDFECRVKDAAQCVPMTNRVDHPVHYNTGGIETIDYLESALTPDEYVGFLKGNILKYLSRERFKNGIEDCKKAKWYMDRLVSFSEKA